MTLICGDCNLLEQLGKQLHAISHGTYDLRRMFSGFRSQWIRRASFKTVIESSNCAVKTLTS